MVSDDIVNIVVERVVFEMANWATQMMKVMYDKPHYVKDLGPDGQYLEIEMTRDRIDDGIAVNVKASTVDKQQRRLDALTLAARRSIDPLSLIEDLDMPNPKERAKRLMAFLGQDPSLYAKVIGIEFPQASGTTNKTPDESKQQAILDIQRLTAGEEFEPSTPDEAYIQVFTEYVQSDEFQGLDDEQKQRFMDYVAKLKQAIAQQLTPGSQPTPTTVEPIAPTAPTVPPVI